MVTGTGTIRNWAVERRLARGSQTPSILHATTKISMSYSRSAAILFAFTLTGTFLFAQGDKTRTRVRMGMEGEGDARMAPIGLVKTSPNGLLLQRQEVDADGVVKGRLDLYDRVKLGFLRAQPPVEKLPNNLKVVPDRAVVFGGRTLMVARHHGADATTLYYQVLEPNITKMPPPYESFCSWSGALPAATTAAPSSFEYHFTPDSTLLLLRGPMLQAAGGFKSMLAVVDKNMQVRWQQAFTAGEGAIRASVLDAAVDTSGTAYILVSDRSAKSDVLDGRPTTRITLYQVGKDGTAIANIPLAREYFLTNAVLRQLPGGKLALAGVYARMDGDRVAVQGDLITMVGADGKVAEPMLVPHAEDNSLVAEGEPQPVQGQKFVEKDVERLMSGIRIVDLLPRKDGGFFLVKELYFMETYFDLKEKRTLRRFIHGPAQATSVDKGGSVLWNSLFRRWYQSASPTLGDLLCGTYGEELFFFAMDSEQMAGLRKTGGKMAPNMMEGPYTAQVNFDAKGAPKVKQVLKGGDESGYICGQQLIRVGAAEYYTFASEKPDGGRYLPVRIDFSTETK